MALPPRSPTRTLPLRDGRRVMVRDVVTTDAPRLAHARRRLEPHHQMPVPGSNSNCDLVALDDHGSVVGHATARQVEVACDWPRAHELADALVRAIERDHR
jgi:CBS-domain-containing membrane protein